MFFHNSAGRKVGATVLLIVLTFWISFSALFGAARPARAQYVDPVTSIQTTLSNIWSKLTDAMVEGVSVALANAANYFMSQLAYQVAVGIVSGCPGQKPCTVTSFLGDAVKGAAQGALGEALGSLSKAGGFEALGINLCAPPSANFGLSIQLGLLNEAKPPAPKCDFNQVMNNWKTAAASLSPSELQKNVWQGFKPGAAPLSMSLHATEKIKTDILYEKDKKLSEQLAKMSGAGGFQDVTDMVTKQVKTPAAAVKAEFERGQREKYEYPKIFQQIQNAGQQARGSVWGAILLNAAQTFGQTLLAQLWNKLVNKIFSMQQGAPEEQTVELIATEEGVVTTGKTEQEDSLSQTVQFGAGAAPVPMTDVGVIDPMSQFSICPDTGRGIWNCVVDTQLSAGVRLGTSMPVTVSEAIDKGYLHGDWPLISALDKAKNSSEQCFSTGYCQGNLAKLRAARILPVGWEIAASLSSVSNPYKLKDALDNFDNQNSPLYHLIDPGWVLKQPLTRCKAQVFGSLLISPEIARRSQYCVDAPTCLKEDDNGTCVGGWGYCTRERNVWRFNGDSCPEQYNTCRTLKSRLGTTANYITNTIDRGTCSASNVGCRRYATGLNSFTCTLGSVCVPAAGAAGCNCTLPASSTQCQVSQNNRSCLTPIGELCILNETQCVAASCTCNISYSCLVPSGALSCTTIVGNAVDKGDDWRTSPAKFFNKSVQACSVDKNGCSQLTKFDKGQSLNLVKNGSFDVLEDADGDGEPDHAQYWSPFGVVSGTGLAATVKDVNVIDGTYSVRVGAAPSTASGSCTGAICALDVGCPCVSGTSKCLIAKGESGCSLTTRLVQDRLQIFKDRSYTLSGSFRRDRCAVNQGSTSCTLPVGGSCSISTCSSSSATWDANLSKCYCYTSSGSATMRLSFMDGIAQNAVSLATNDMSASLKGGTSCGIVGGNLELVASVGTDATVASCTFLTNVDISNAKLDIYGSNTVADNVMLEEGGGTDFHDGYGDAASTVFAKVPPSYLGCTGEDNEPIECKSFAAVCRDTEIGCDLYSPVSGDPAVPGITGPTDSCPAECEGYDVFKQGTSEFERQEKFPIYFIPSTAKSCTEGEVGCSEFTDILTEDVAFYSKLRMCQLPEAADNQVYYSWEGSDTTGFQLKVWTFKKSAGLVNDGSVNGSACTTDASCTTSPMTACRGGYCVNPKPADICADTAHLSCAGGRAGSAPCTQLWYNSSGAMACADKVCSSGNRAGKGCGVDADCIGGGSCNVPGTDGRCSKADIDAGNLDCREFYDEFGNRHYRLLTKAIVATPECRRYRITDALLDDCETSNGKWDTAKKECVYLASLRESTACSKQSNGCRAYKGNAATNVNVKFTDSFEGGVTEWQKLLSGGDNSGVVSQSSEAISVGGHSLKVASAGSAFRNISGLVEANRSYSVSFWARGSGKLKVVFADASWPAANRLCTVTNCQGDSCKRCFLPDGLQCTNAGTTAEGGSWSCNVKSMAENWTPQSPPVYVPFSDKITGCTNNLTTGCASDAACGGAGKCTHADNRCSNDLTKACRTASDCGVGNSCVRISLLTLSSDWRQYTLGPVIVANNPYFGKSHAYLLVETDSGADTFIDNFLMKEVQDNIFVVRNSWNIPAVCDQAADGSAAPLEMLGCRQYTNSASQQVFLRTFSKLCREKAVGCTAYSDLQNTPNNFYEESFNAVCTLPSVCVPSLGMANCTCNYKLTHPAANATYPPVLADVCRVQANETSCRFHLNGLDKFAGRSASADIAFIPADQRVNLVVSSEMKCQSSDAGCKTFGSPTLIYEGTCSTTTAGGCATSPSCLCTDAKTGLTCKIPTGQNSCKFSSERPIISEWKASAFKDDPAKYEQTLCREDEVGCESYTAKDGTWYFKDPGNATCEYKDTVTIDGVTRAGWFRKSASGGIFPCYPELLRSGKFFEINRNKDKFCSLATKCVASTGCLCYDQTNPTQPVCKVGEGGTVCGYRGWVGTCDAKYNLCEEFVDPLATTAAHPAGEPYYYIVNNKLDLNSCAGTVSLKQGCVLFNQTSVSSKLYSAPATYTRAQKETGSTGGKVNSLNCDTQNRNDLCKKRCVSYRNAFCHGPAGYANEGTECKQDTECPGYSAATGFCGASGYCSNNASKYCIMDADCRNISCTGQRVFGFGCTNNNDCSAANNEVCVAEPSSLENQPLLRRITKNDTNIIIKVRRDRECAEWLTCSRESTTWDDTAKKYKSTCTDFTSCGGSSQMGQVMECVNFVEPPLARLTKDTYKVRDTSWGGLDYAGFSLPNKYPVQYLSPIKVLKTGLTLPGVCVSDGTIKDGMICDASLGAANTCGSGICSIDPLAIQRFGVKKFIGGAGCTSDNNCPLDDSSPAQRGLCYQGYCYYNLDGGKLDLERVANGPSCRAFPEADSPFGPSVLEGGSAGYDSSPETGMARDYAGSFKGANVCKKGNYCECSYKRAGYGKNQGTRFFSMMGGAPSAGICSGGVNDGVVCTPPAGDECKGQPDPADNGRCVRLTSQLNLLGWPGFCIDGDTSININNSEAQQACNLWLPVDALAGMPNRFNQFTEAGYYFDAVGDLNYCTNADGAALGDNSPPSDTYTNEFTPVCGECLNRAFDGVGGGGDDASVTNWPFRWYSSRRSWGAVSNARKGKVEKFQIRLDDDDSTSDTTGNDSILELSRSNNWTVVVDFDSLSTTPQTFTTNNGNQTCGSLLWVDENVNWNDYWFLEYGTVTGITNVDCVGAQLIWSDTLKPDGTMFDPAATGDNAYPLAIRAAMSHERDNNYAFDAGATIFFRESCREFVNVKGGANAAVAMTSNVYEAEKAKRDGGSYVVSGMDMGKYWTWDTTSTTVSPVSLSPFGHASPVGAPSSGFMTIAQSEGGTDWNSPTKSALALSCTGPCNLIESSNKGSSAATSYGRPRLSSMFVKFYSIKTSTNGTSFTNVDAATVNSYDKRSTLTSAAQVPKIVPVDTGKCFDKDGTLLCLESAKAGFTVNDQIDTDVKTEPGAGRLKASVKYYAYADPNHMPIRYKLIDFGDGSVVDGSPGYYKNHRGGEGTGKLTPICMKADTWGLTDPSCEPRYFEDSKTYICNTAKIAQIGAGPNNGVCQALDSPAEFYPCIEDGACVFRPRVQIIDNWGFCNGSCPLAPGTGSTCMNNVVDPTAARYANGDECDPDIKSTLRPANKMPWTWFSKRIFVYPSQ